MVFDILKNERSFSSFGLLGLMPASDITCAKNWAFGIPNSHFLIESLESKTGMQPKNFSN